MPDEVLIVAQASTPRRALGVCVIGVLGLFMFYLVFTRPLSDLGLQVFLVVVGIGALWLATKMWRAGQLDLELTHTELRSSDGRVVATLENIASLDRSTLAFKPSNGFLLRLKDSDTLVWEPGLWWRWGRRIGVGGITSAAHTKAMSEIMAALLAERDAKTFRD